MNLKKMSKKERIRIKGLDNFIKNAGSIAGGEFDKLTTIATGGLSNEQIRDYRHMFQGGFLKAIELMVIKMNESH